MPMVLTDEPPEFWQYYALLFDRKNWVWRYMLADFYSYIPTLVKVLRGFKPQRIFEYGCGASTEIIRMIATGAEVYSVEDQEKYYKPWEKADTQRFHVIFESDREAYVRMPLTVGGKFDLIFIDGLDELRPKCLITASDCLSDTGLILLHDCERENYQEAIKCFDILERSFGTMVLTKKTHLANTNSASTVKTAKTE